MDYIFPQKLFPVYFNSGPPSSTFRHNVGGWGSYGQVLEVNVAQHEVSCDNEIDASNALSSSLCSTYYDMDDRRPESLVFKITFTLKIICYFTGVCFK